jgi:hypothetical protein
MRALVGDRAMTHSARHDEEVSAPKLNRFTMLHLDPKTSVPAQEELVFAVTMPGELALQARDANDRVVDDGEVLWHPRRRERGRCVLHVDFSAAASRGTRPFS